MNTDKKKILSTRHKTRAPIESRAIFEVSNTLGAALFKELRSRNLLVELKCDA